MFSFFKDFSKKVTRIMTAIKKKINLKDVFKHSKLVEQVNVEDIFSLEIRPWTVVELEVLQPLVYKIYNELKKKDKNLPAIEAFMLIIKDKEFLGDIMNIVYTSLQRCNETIIYKPTGEEMDLFEFEDMRNYLTLPYIFDIAKIIWKQNIEQNPLMLSNQKAQQVNQVTE